MGAKLKQVMTGKGSAAPSRGQCQLRGSTSSTMSLREVQVELAFGLIEAGTDSLRDERAELN
jgi:hypothetical protein